MGEMVDRDDEHLKLLSIFYYVLASVMALGGLVPVIHIAIGSALLSGVIDGADDEVRWVGALLIGLGLGIMALVWTFAALLFLTGRFLGRRTNRTFCMVIAALSCLHFPYGTLLGVFTFMVLVRPTVRELFSAAPETA